MATSYTSNKKIGALDSASTPLAATNEIVINQNGDILKTPLSAVEAKVFDAKTAVTNPSGTEVVIVRQTDNTLRQVTLSDIVPALNITNAKVSASAAIEDTKLATINTAGKVTNNAVQAVSALVGGVYDNGVGANKIVTRDGSGNFAAGTITATLSGNATTATTLATGRTLALTGDVTGTTEAFNGSANVIAATTIANNAVTTAKIADANVTTAKIANANVTLDKLVAAVQEALVPVGGILPFGRTSAPSGWLACDGQAVARTGTYAALFAAIGTTWGAGDGSTTFNVPDLRDRYLRHAGATYSGAVGTTQSDEVKSHTHTAATNSAGEHTHTGTTDNESADHTHTFSGTTSSNGSHNHTTQLSDGGHLQYDGGGNGIAGTNRPLGADSLTSTNGAHTHTYSGTTSGRSAAHTHSFSTSSNGGHAHTVTVNNTGGTENRPYSATVLYCIKF